MDPNSNNNSTGANDAASKRQALTGQWRTPPLPVFASSQQQQPHHPAQDQVASVPPAQAPLPPLPESTDDYAKALQEAYRRGAEAAAAMQQQQQQQPQMSNAVSCPNFHLAPVAATTTTTTQPAPAPVVEPMPQQQPQQQQEPVLLVPNPLASMPPPSSGSNAARSYSLPDMASYAARAQAEEEKRKKRLARNRASARLRRLRKKNLVDSYEGEVGVLELSLQKLKAHTWGAGNDHEALLEALGMERGQQALSSEERSSLVQEILQQQSDQVALIQQVQQEQQVLRALATTDPQGDPLLQDLEQVLDLTPAQRESLQRATNGLAPEVQALQTLEGCLEAMKSRLDNTATNDIAHEFLSILHANQVSKFLLWTDGNAEAIDQLDYCHAGPPAQSPIFSFGMDDYGGSSQLNLNTAGADTQLDQDKAH